MTERGRVSSHRNTGLLFRNDAVGSLRIVTNCSRRVRFSQVLCKCRILQLVSQESCWVDVTNCSCRVRFSQVLRKCKWRILQSVSQESCWVDVTNCSCRVRFSQVLCKCKWRILQLVSQGSWAFILNLLQCQIRHLIQRYRHCSKSRRGLVKFLFYIIMHVFLTVNI